MIGKFSLKYKVTFLVLAVCLFPTLLNRYGLDFTSVASPLDGHHNIDDIFHALTGEIHHALLEWSAIVLACLVTLTSFLHYQLKKDITVPIIGLAFLCAGIVDSFHTLAALRLIDASADNTDFIPFTWALSRVYNASLMLLAASLVLFLSKKVLSKKQHNITFNKRLLTGIGIVFLSSACYVFYWAASLETLPETQFPSAIIKRPYDAIPLGLFIACAVFYWLIYKDKTRAFRLALFLSILPEIATQLHMAFGSSQLFDNHFNIAHFLKVVAYGVVLLGIIFDLIGSGIAQTKSTNVISQTPINADTFEANEKEVLTKKRNSLSFKLPVISFVLTMFIAGIVGVGVFLESMRILDEQRQLQLTQVAAHTKKQIYREYDDVYSKLEKSVIDNELISILNADLPENILAERVPVALKRITLENKLHNLYLFKKSDANSPQAKDNVIGFYEQETSIDLPRAYINHWLNTASVASEEIKRHFISVIKINEIKYWFLGTPVMIEGEKGLLITVSDFSQITQIIQGTIFNHIQVILTSRSGDIVLDTLQSFELNQAIVKQRYPALNRKVKAEDGSGSTFKDLVIAGETYSGIHQILPFKHVDKDRFVHLFVLHPDTQFQAYFKQIRERAIVIGISLAIVVLSLSIFASQKLTHTLVQILKAIKGYQETRKINDLPVGATDEIGVLARNFAHMMKEINQRTLEQKEAVAKANNASTRLQAILDSMVDAVITIDEYGHILAFNKSAQSMFGYSENEVLGENIKLLMPTAFADAHDGHLEHYRNTGEQHILSQSRELPAKRKDGDTFSMILSVSETQTEDGKVFTGLIRDITATKLLENEREHIFNEANELAWRLDFALSGPKIGVWDYNIESRALSWDKRMFKLYGYDVEQNVEPKSIWKSALHPEDAERIKRSLLHSVEAGSDFKEVFRIILPNMEVNYIESFAKPFYSLDGKISRIVGTNRDVTEQFQLQELEQKALKMAEDSLRLKSEFLASMSHEIRTPMNGVLGMLGLIEQGELNQRQRHYVQLANSSAQSLLTLINDILDFSKIEAGKLTLEMFDFDIKQQLGEIVESLAFKAQEKDIELILDVNGIDKEMVQGDPTRLRQVVSNLVSNAIKFTEQGEVVVRASTETITDDHIRLCCSVTDSGIGIPEDKMETLFDSFTQVDASTTRKYGGTGLGLAIVKQLCTLMGGDIKVSSEMNKGSTFEFTLSYGISENQNLVMPSIEINGTNILIVDDNSTNLEVLEGQLLQWGAKVSKAESGKQALAIVEKHPMNHFKIAILDMQMPEMDGAELGKTLKQSMYCQQTKLIMMTSIGIAGDASYFAELGFSAYFSKPATTSDIYNAIAVVLDNNLALAHAKPLVTHEHLQTLRQNSPSPLSNQDIKILLVEDNRINQAVVLGILESIGCTAEVAMNGKEALEKLAKTQDGVTFQVILMDCQMPIMDGYQTTRAIRSGEYEGINKEIPIIAMTANAMKGDREKCLESGMSDYLAKPIDSNLLMEKLSLWVKEFEQLPDKPSSVDSNTSTSNIERLTTGSNDETLWDEKGLLNRVRQNSTLAKKLVEMFLDESPELLKSMLKAIDTESYQESAAIAHKIKGSVRNLGGIKLGFILQEIEQASKECNIVLLKQLRVEFEVGFNTFTDLLGNSTLFN